MEMHTTRLTNKPHTSVNLHFIALLEARCQLLVCRGKIDLYVEEN